MTELRKTGRWAGAALAGFLAVAGAGCSGAPPSPDPAPTPTPADIDARVHEFCGACHNYPPPDTFPRSAWKKEVEQGYVFFGRASMNLKAPPIDDVVRHFEDRAPLELPAAVRPEADRPYPVGFDKVAVAGLPGDSPPAVSNVNLVHLSDPHKLDLLACEMRWGHVMTLNPRDPAAGWKVIGKATNPAHAEVVDLDRDGIPDVLVADLGNFSPTDLRCGKVLWLRGKPDGTYEPHTLLENVGRVADVQAADFNGDGKLDLVVGVFGWQTTGEVLYLENKTTDWAHPEFEPHVVDKRHGAIHVPVTDLDGDGRPDFVALIAQEHETVVAYLNRGGGTFEQKTLYAAPHPAYGSSGIQLVDLNGDGKLDVLYTNGDVLDQPYLLKPYHSIQWLENKGNLEFEHHPLAPLYGVHRAVAADFRGTGRLDVAAVSFLPAEGFPQRDKLNLASVIMLEQTEPGRFVCHTLETVSCDHVTCVAGDLFGSGRPDLVTGTFTSGGKAGHSVEIWKNLGKKP
jgi:hypothetical protein